MKSCKISFRRDLSKHCCVVKLTTQTFKIRPSCIFDIPSKTIPVVRGLKPLRKMLLAFDSLANVGGIWPIHELETYQLLFLFHRQICFYDSLKIPIKTSFFHIFIDVWGSISSKIIIGISLELVWLFFRPSRISLQLQTFSHAN